MGGRACTDVCVCVCVRFFPGFPLFVWELSWTDILKRRKNTPAIQMLLSKRKLPKWKKDSALTPVVGRHKNGHFCFFFLANRRTEWKAWTSYLNLFDVIWWYYVVQSIVLHKLNEVIHCSLFYKNIYSVYCPYLPTLSVMCGRHSRFEKRCLSFLCFQKFASYMAFLNSEIGNICEVGRRFVWEDGGRKQLLPSAFTVGQCKCLKSDLQGFTFIEFIVKYGIAGCHHAETQNPFMPMCSMLSIEELHSLKIAEWAASTLKVCGTGTTVLFLLTRSFSECVCEVTN